MPGCDRSLYYLHYYNYAKQYTYHNAYYCRCGGGGARDAWRGSWHSWHLWRWTMRCGDVQRSGHIVTRVTRVMDGHVPGPGRYYIVHSQGWSEIYLHQPKNNDLGIHGDDDSSLLNGTMTVSIMKKKIPWRGREFSVWATSVLWRYCFENVITLSQLSTLLSDCLTSGHWTFLLLKWPWHSYVYVFWRQLYFSLYSDPGICDLQLLVTQCSACSTAAANITTRVVFQTPGLFILRTIFTRINIFGNILQGN